MPLPEDDRYSDRPPDRRDEGYGDRPARRRPDDNEDFDYEPRRRFRSADVPNYLVQAVLVTLLCCWPAGLVAIIFAAQVNSKLAGGDYEGAVRASGNAKTWCWVSVIGALVIVLLYIVAIAVSGLN
jgi:hypothetical protein